MHEKLFWQLLTLMPVFPTRHSHLSKASQISSSKLISVIKQYREVTVSFLVLQTEVCRFSCSVSVYTSWQAILAAQWFHTWLIEIGNHPLKRRFHLLPFLNAVDYWASWCGFQIALTRQKNPPRLNTAAWRHLPFHGSQNCWHESVFQFGYNVMSWVSHKIQCTVWFNSLETTPVSEYILFFVWEFVR